MEEGIMYALMRDKSFRPIIIVNVERMVASKVQYSFINE